MTDTIHNFKLLSTEFIELQSSKIPLKVYQSLTTGFRVILVDKPGSCCFGTIVVPTLCSDDSGLPHTLEHLIFCSSKNYPNRGYLEACSVRCLSNGTNAWTDNDHTAYTISTAGYEGMAYALPVFLDHVINPTLHDRDFVTEVYHVDGEGKQKGVVFSEMVSRETSQEDLLYRYLNKRLYRDTTTYSKECGGLTPDIAKLTNERIKNYHSEFYTLKNSTAILVGNNINDSLILEQLDNSPTFKTSGNSIDLKHVQEFPDPKISPPLTEPFTVNFPADDDGSIGSIGFNWYGPYHNDLEARLGLSLLLNYLTYDVSSPLQQAFVAIDHPWATEVYYDVSSAPRTSLMLQFTGVPYETDESTDADDEANEEENDEEGEDEGPVPEELKHLFEPDFFKNKFLTVLKEALDNLNHDELKASIDHYQLEVLRSWEKNPDSNTTSLLIPLLVADRFTDLPLTQALPSATKSFKLLSELGKKPLSYWKQLGYDWLLDSPCSNVLAVPNPELGEKLESERAQRQQETIKELGTEKLSEIAKDLEKIIEENKVKISSEDIDNLPPTPNLSNLSKLNINQNLISLEPKEDWPFPNLQIIETSTEFVTLRLGLSTKEIPIELYDYLVVFFALLYETEVRVPGEPPMTYQQVINKTKSLMESTSNTMGQSGDLLVSGWISDILFLTASGEPSKFEPMLDWMFNMLQFTYFTEDRILNVSKVLLSDIDDSLRWGFTLCSRLIDVVFNDKHQNKSNLLSKSLNFVNQKKFLKSIISTLSSNNETEKAKIINNLDVIRDSLFKKGLISGPVQLGIPEGKWSTDYLVSTLQSSWTNVYKKLAENNVNIKQADNTSKPTGFPAPRAPFQSPSELSHPRHFYLPLATLTSSYCLTIMPCDTYAYGNDLQNPNHIKTMAINVLCKLISQMEGPLSERIRGKGYAYGAQLSLYSWSGAIVYQVWKSVDPSNSLKVFWDFLEEMKDEDYFNKVVNQFQLDQTKSSMIYSACYKQDTSNRIVYGALTNSFQGYESYQQYTSFYNQNLEKVTIADVRQVFLDHLLPMTKSNNFQTLILTPADSKDGESLLGPLKNASEVSKTQIDVDKLDLQDLVNFY